MNLNVVQRLQLWALRALRRPYYDLALIGALLLLAICGLVTLYSASDLDRHLVLNQAARFLLGGVLMLAVARIPPSVLRNWTPWLYIASLLLLLAVAVLGQGRGANRWLNLGFYALSAVGTGQADPADDGRNGIRMRARIAATLADPGRRCATDRRAGTVDRQTT